MMGKVGGWWVKVEWRVECRKAGKGGVYPA